jgi:uncharacterized protein
MESIILTGTFAAGLLSLSHCAVMCGPLMLIFRNDWLSYQIGRVAGYTAIGSLLGIAGYSLDKGGHLLSFQNACMWIGGFLMVFYGLIYILPSDLTQKPDSSLGKISYKINSILLKPAYWISSVKKKSGLPTVVSVFLAGFLSALLPCGVLYPVWALAAGSGSPVFGAAVGGSFVLGTIPGLLAFQWITKKAGHRINIFHMLWIRRIAMVILVSTGISMIIYRDNISPGMSFTPEAREKAEICTDPAMKAAKESAQSDSVRPELKTGNN